MPMSEASRRHFLAGGSALVGLSCTGAGKGAGGGGGGRSFTLSVGWLETELLLSPASPPPAEDTGDSGAADTASPAPGCIAEVTRLPARLRAYNGQVPGPTLELSPGESISITVENGLPPYDSSAWEGEANVPHMLHSTNLHLHGMAVIPHLFAPVGTLDPAAPMIAVDPGASFTWHFDLPQDHPPGLYGGAGPERHGGPHHRTRGHR
jgi:FtsP/CotA-like multicopper oxidase with cupredoxin domain